MIFCIEFVSTRPVSVMRILYSEKIDPGIYSLYFTQKACLNQVIDMKTLLLKKLKQKYNVYHVNNLKSTVQFTLK